MPLRFQNRLSCRRRLRCRWHGRQYRLLCRGRRRFEGHPCRSGEEAEVEAEAEAEVDHSLLSLRRQSWNQVSGSVIRGFYFKVNAVGYYMPSPDFNSVPAGEVQACGFTTPQMCLVLPPSPPPQLVQPPQTPQPVSTPTGKPPHSRKVPGSAAGSSVGGSRIARRFVPQFNIRKPFVSSSRDSADMDSPKGMHSIGEYIATAGGDEGSRGSVTGSEQSVRRIVVEDLPLPPDYHNSINRMHLSNKMREERLQRSKENEFRQYTKTATVRPDKTVPRDYGSHVDKRLESKFHSFRKVVDKSDPDSLPQAHRVQPMTSSAKMLGIHDTTSSYFLSTLRDDTRDSTVPAPSSKNDVSKVGTVYRSQADAFFDDRDSSDRARAQGPNFFHMYGVERRSSERSERKKQEEIDAMARADSIRAYKDHLHQTAVRTAVVSGAYIPEAQQHHHQKVLLKYGNSVHVNVNAVAATRRDYFAKHSVQTGSPRGNNGGLQWDQER
jgi:hypothetical protein